jgi:hypothetical protein
MSGSHDVTFSERRALFGGTLFVVRCTCNWEAMATAPETARELMFAHLSDEGAL